MDITDAEAQILAALHGAASEDEPTDRAALERRGECYRPYLADWAHAFEGLTGRGLIERNGGGFRLTEAGRPVAEACYRERPDRWWYFYRAFYRVAPVSPAYAKFCHEVYGGNLCQHGLTDMAALDELLGRLDIRRGDTLLDLGCGPGIIAEHIGDRTGALVTGIDNSAPAIAAACARTQAKRDRMDFRQADMNALDLPARRFDAAVSIDTLYFVADIADTLAQVVPTIKPGGQLAIFFMQWLEEGDGPARLTAGGTWLAEALGQLGLAYEAVDHTRRIHAFWRRAAAAARALHGDFEAEGNGFIAEHWRTESDEYCGYIERDALTRYLYIVRL